MDEKYPEDEKQMKDHKTYDPSRRKFLKNTGLVAGGVVGGSFLGGLLTNNYTKKNEIVAKPGTENTADFQEALQFFTRNEDFAVLQAATEQIFPKDENGPGAIELRAPYYIDKQLAGQWGVNAKDYRLGPFITKTKISERPEEKRGEQSILDRGSIFLLGLRKMNEESMKRFNITFDKANETQQIEILQDFETGEIKLNGLLSQEFFFLLQRSTIEGVYSDPLYGGNKNMDGWRMKEFPGAQASYTAVIESEDFVKMDPVSLRNYQGH
ncbi:gluconate 2-dehydrogenase subunit 3 family protein [Sporosarcina siberiensis]|uniref:Gluconate 2-dehydrogenase subunit 3 family protein n=1 Tax=Sporosarcina siberiensis TaxID=1365606 RepID=A0ABW4SM50_9BACL